MDSNAISASPSPLMIACEKNLHGHISFLARSIPGMAVLDDEHILIVDSGLPSDTFNKVARARLAGAQIDRGITRVLQYFGDAGRPFAWWVGPVSRPLDLEARLRQHGFEAAEAGLGMFIELRHLPAHVTQPMGLEIRRVAIPEDVSAFADVFAANWEPPDPAVLTFYAAASSILLEARSPMILFVGYLDGAPVSVSELYIDRDPGGVAGLYSVATKKEFRGRGIGTALTWAAVNEARRQGYATAVLQASDAGQGVYTRLGFNLCCQFTEYTPP
jgi:ribosomal protein S18 acetylase RimI-like enzyme